MSLQKVPGSIPGSSNFLLPYTVLIILIFFFDSMVRLLFQFGSASLQIYLAAAFQRFWHALSYPPYHPQASSDGLYSTLQVGANA